MEQATDAPLVARFNRERSQRIAYVLAGVVVLSAVYGGWGAPPGTVILLGLLIGVVLVGTYVSLRRIARAGGVPQLVIDAAGMAIPEHFAGKIPWEDIASARVLRPAERPEYLLVDIPMPSRYGPQEKPSHRRLREMAGNSEYRIYTQDFDVSSLDIENALARFAPQSSQAAAVRR